MNEDTRTQLQIHVHKWYIWGISDNEENFINLMEQRTDMIQDFLKVVYPKTKQIIVFWKDYFSWRLIDNELTSEHISEITIHMISTDILTSKVIELTTISRVRYVRLTYLRNYMNCSRILWHSYVWLMIWQDTCLSSCMCSGVFHNIRFISISLMIVIIHDHL